MAINILINLFDDESTDFYDSLDQAVRNNYNQTKENMILHYETVGPQSTQWSLLTKRKQSSTESITDYYDDLVKMGRRLNVPQEQLLFMFIDGLPEDTKIHLALSLQAPGNIVDALTMAKTFQAVTKNINPVNTLYKQVQKDMQQPLSSAIQQVDQNK